MIFVGCTPERYLDGESVPEPAVAEKNFPEAEAPEKIIGPLGCVSGQECGDYCSKNPLDCRAWCKTNKEPCTKLGLQGILEMPEGIPNSPCALDNECLTGLCLNFKCDIPNPENLAKKSGFALPGSCASISDCARYCSLPENKDACLTFCDNFPSFCTNLNEIRASTVPKECSSCTTCASKDCILDCTYRCYAFVPVEEPNLAELKESLVLERKYQKPIKAVWEPGPAYNRIGMTYFAEDYLDLGVNAYSITPKYNRKEGKLVHSVDHAIGEKADNEKIATIIKAKKAGFQVVLVAHDLYDMFPDVNKNEKFSPETYIDEIKNTSLKWAAIAEEYQVEYFVPVNEFEYILYENGYTAEQACEITNKMYREMIPQVREIFKGKIYCRVGGMDAQFACMDFSLCDIFGFTYGFSSGGYKANFDSGFAVAEELYQKYQKPYLMAEAFALLIRGTPLAECANLHTAGIASYKEKASHGEGYTFMGLVQRDPINKNDCTITEAGVVEKYKNFFTWMNGNRK